MSALKYLEEQMAALGDKTEHERWDTACRAIVELAQHVGALTAPPPPVVDPAPAAPQTTTGKTRKKAAAKVAKKRSK